MLRRQTGPDDVVRVRQQFDADAADVRVYAARGHEQRLTGLEHAVVEQQRGDQAEVPGVVGAHPDHRVVRGHPRAAASGLHRGGLHHARHQRGALGLRPLQQGGQGAPDGRGLGLLAQPGGQHLELRHAEAVEHLGGLRRRAQPGEHLEGLEGAEDLGLGPVVHVHPLAGAERHPGRVLPGESVLGLRAGRVQLHRQRLLRGQHLEQERQPAAEAFGDLFAEFVRRGGVDRGPQGRGASVPGEHRGGVRVGTHPQFGLRPRAGRGLAEQIGYGRVRTPGVGLDGVAQQIHGVGLLAADSTRSSEPERCARCTLHGHSNVRP